MAEMSPVEPPPVASCVRCTADSVGACCSSHGKELCHRCYRLTHFVEVCVVGCRECADEGLSPVARVLLGVPNGR